MQDHPKERARDARTLPARLERLIELASALSTQQEESLLMEKILLGAKELTHAEGATLYRMQQHALRFSIVMNDKLQLHCGGSKPSCGYPDVPVVRSDGEPNLHNVSAYTAFMKRSVNIPDAYLAEGFNFSGTQAMDERLGYRSKSFLTVPLLNHRMETIGVLQLINRLDENDEVVDFSSEDQAVAEALASLAAIALENHALIHRYRSMFESTISLLADAVDKRSPHTGRHSRRVPELAERLGKAYNRSPLKGESPSLSGAQVEALRLASFLHDAGKISIPDALLDKKTRLWYPTDQMEMLRLRCMVLQLQNQLKDLGQEPSQQLEGDLVEAWQLIEHCNDQAAFVSPEEAERVEELAAQLHFTWMGSTHPVIEPHQAVALSIPRGTLTAEERKALEVHPMQSFELLRRIPFTGPLQEVPVIARDHHEKCDGSGYPHGLTRPEMSVSSRIIPIADVFEALTAPDRTYRKPTSVEEAESVLRQMVEAGHLDPVLVDVFIEEGVGEDYGRSFLQPWQLKANNTILDSDMPRAAGE